MKVIGDTLIVGGTPQQVTSIEKKYLNTCLQHHNYKQNGFDWENHVPPPIPFLYGGCSPLKLTLSMINNNSKSIRCVKPPNTLGLCEYSIPMYPLNRVYAMQALISRRFFSPPDHLGRGRTWGWSPHDCPPRYSWPGSVDFLRFRIEESGA